MKNGRTMKNIFKYAVIALITAAFGFIACANSGSGGGVTKSSEKAITAFGFGSPAATGVIDQANHAISVDVPYLTDTAALVAVFTTTGAIVTIGDAEQTSGTTVNDFTDPVTYTVTAEDGSAQNYTVTVAVAASWAKAITGFAFESPAVIGTINETNHTIAVTVPYGTNVASLTPVITHTGASINPASGEAQDFRSLVTYKVTAADSSEQNYIVTVTVAASSAKAIIGFAFTNPAATGIINETNHTIAVTVPFGTNVLSLTPTITHTGASIYPASGVAQNFTGQVTYTLTAADSSIQVYTVTVTVAPPGPACKWDDAGLTWNMPGLTWQ